MTALVILREAKDLLFANCKSRFFGRLRLPQNDKLGGMVE